MWLKRFILLLLSVFCACSLFAQGELTQSRILILLDESSSMIQPWAGGMEKYKAADSLIMRLMDSVYALNSDVEFSLRVFGHQHTVEENNCFDTKNEVPFSKDNRTQMAFRLADIRPLGVTPIAYALEQAATYDLTDEAHNAYSIILITDGGESCGGDICEVMRRLMQSKVYFKPYIVSLEDYPPLKTMYACMGNYLQVTRKSDIAQAVNTIVTAFRPVLKITKADYKQLQAIAASAPSILKENIPINVTEPVGNPKPVKPITIQTDTIIPVKTFSDNAPPRPVIVPKAPPAPAPRETPHDTTVAVANPEPPKPVHHIIVNEAPPRPQARKITSLTPAPLKSFDVYPATFQKAKIMPLPLTLPPVVSDTTAAPRKLARIEPPSLIPPDIHAAKREKAKTAEVPLPLPPVVSDTVVTRHKIERLKPARLKTFNVLFIVEDRIFTQRSVPPLPPVKFDNVANRVDSKIPIPLRQPVPPGKKGNYSVETEDAKETSLAIYFTDGFGKFYTTTPQMVLMDPRMNKIIKKFYRTVDANGEPDPQTDIPEGMYDIAVVGSRNVIIHDVDIVKDKKNKLIIKIKKCTLKFVYKDAPERLVKEFMAIVTERDKLNGKIVTQKCTEELMYEPGNYHIDINTFPKDTRNVDLDLDDETVIAIAQPGFAKFTDEVKTRVISLYTKDGDKFLPFYTLDLRDPASQHLQIQPGEYQAHYHKGPGGSSYANEKVVPFIIKATEETEVILK